MFGRGRTAFLVLLEPRQKEELPVQHWSDRVEDSGCGTFAGGSAVMLGGAFAADFVRPDPSLGTYAEAYKRKQQTQRRLLWLQSLWNDPARFDAIVASGRYLKLCALLEWASANDEIAGRLLDSRC